MFCDYVKYEFEYMVITRRRILTHILQRYLFILQRRNRPRNCELYPRTGGCHRKGCICGSFRRCERGRRYGPQGPCHSHRGNGEAGLGTIHSGICSFPSSVTPLSARWTLWRPWLLITILSHPGANTRYQIYLYGLITETLVQGLLSPVSATESQRNFIRLRVFIGWNVETYGKYYHISYTDYH